MSILDHSPRFSVDDARRFAQELYGLSAIASPLPSERDQNFLLLTEAGERFVLKIANATEARRPARGAERGDGAPRPEPPALPARHADHGGERDRLGPVFGWPDAFRPAGELSAGRPAGQHALSLTGAAPRSGPQRGSAGRRARELRSPGRPPRFPLGSGQRSADCPPVRSADHGCGDAGGGRQAGRRLRAHRRARAAVAAPERHPQRRQRLQRPGRRRQRPLHAQSERRRPDRLRRHGPQLLRWATWRWPSRTPSSTSPTRSRPRRRSSPAITQPIPWKKRNSRRCSVW